MLGANHMDEAGVFTIFGLHTRAASSNYSERMLYLRAGLHMLIDKKVWTKMFFFTMLRNKDWPVAHKTTEL